MSDLDLDARLERLAAAAAGDATVPDLEDVVRRGRRGRRRRLAGSALLVAAVTAAALLAPPRLADRAGPALDDEPGVVPATGATGATGIAGYWFGRADASVFLDQFVQPARRQAVLDRIESVGVVDQVFYESSTEAYARFRAQFRHDPDMLAEVDPAVLPQSYRVRLDDPDHFAALYRALCHPGTDDTGRQRCVDGVDSVVAQRAVVEPLLVGTSWPRTTDVTVLLADGAAARRRQAVQARLAAIDVVGQASYESPADALRRLRARYSAERLRRTPGSPPASFRVALRDPRQAAAFVDAFCRSRRTGDCFDGVAMVVEHPRR
jgi:cell division protein FtsX